MPVFNYDGNDRTPMKWKINQKISCQKCGEQEMRRSEFAYRVLIPVILISGAFVIPVLQLDRIPSWVPERIGAIFVLVYLFAFCALGYYEFHDPQRSYRCRACGHVAVIPRPPYSFVEKLAIGFFIASLLLLVGLISALALSVAFF